MFSPDRRSRRSTALGWLVRLPLTLATACGLAWAGTVPVAGFPIPVPAAAVPTAAPLGPHAVGVHVQTFTYQDRPMRITTWYPATATARDPYVTPTGITGAAIEDAPADRSGGPYPLIVFSPGLGTPGDGYYFFTQNLASEGYVVIGIDHWDAAATTPGWSLADIPTLLSGIPTRNMSDSVFSAFSDWFRRTDFGLTYRAQETAFALDAALARNSDPASPLAELIDPDRIGMSGHSLGATYSLFTGGMSIRCEATDTAQRADANSGAMARIDPCTLPSVRALTDPAAMRDPRIKAILAMAPPTFIGQSNIARSAADLRIPVMFINGDDPYMETPRDPQWAIYSAAAGPKYFVEIKNTDHAVACDTVSLNPLLRSLLPSRNHQPAEFAAKADAYMRYSAAFFNSYLKAGGMADTVLTGPPSDQVVAVERTFSS
ncbi:alpha/beta hydrolase family protein [Nocardia yamanashiensis]|uniref:alpha/beta hydrolase family protein n=1 Tax=Nocardia yamanashiensis TaxID=209247 RepID=UPI000831F151|nr:hypothetical protein [Nocardia yamanashiensis]